MSTETSTPQRETAKICSVKDLLTGTYVVQEGWLANYIESNHRRLSRVNLLGFVVSKPGPYDFTLDDGTGTIQVTDFAQQKKTVQLKVGDPVLLIGRPRQNNNIIFIACEIVNNKQLKEEPGWLSYRKKELLEVTAEVYDEPKRPSQTSVFAQATKTSAQPVAIEELLDGEESVEVVEELVPVQDVSGEDIITFIKKKDGGDGCLIEDIISYFGNNIDDHILTLITMGEVYEIKPGRVKVLE
ncbi:MAG: hypothetical protein KC535_00580 [Nanoarchaeota archaeon]|nr:hypothetical protein [Nanoarchaeota archaeon]